MAFLSRLFKGKPSAETNGEAAGHAAAGPEAAPAAVQAPTPTAVRTVMPKTSLPANLRDPGTRSPVSLTSTVPPMMTTLVPSVRATARKITFPVPSSPRPMAASPQLRTTAPTTAPIFSAPEPAPVPEAPDVTVTLEIGDFLDRLPPGFLSPGPFDRHQQVEFRASELYSDLTKGRASVPASTIFAKVPAIFARPVTDTEDTEVSLPLQKLVEQLSASFQTRADQVAEDNVGEIETPFLQVAKEDSERLSASTGVPSGAIRPAMAPAAVVAPAAPEAAVAEAAAPDALALDLPVRPTHRTGQISTISAPKVPLEVPPLPVVATTATATGPINPSKRPPSTVRASVAGGKIRLSGPSSVSRMAPASVQPIPVTVSTAPSTSSQRIQLPGQAASPSLAVSKKTARIQIPPISLRAGGQGSAPARTGGAPSQPAAVPVQPSPVSIRPPAGTDLPVTFRSSPPPQGAKAPPASFAPTLRPNPVPPAVAAPAPAPVAPTPSAPADERQIKLGLAAILQGIPTEALTVEPWTIADDVKVSLPFAAVEKQLSHGRVSLPLDAFVAALPEGYRQVFATGHSLTEIPLPLPEIFQNLPASALAIRPDQVVEETGTLYPTPFSQKADEDAQRFGAAAPAVEKATEEPKTPASIDEPAAAAVLEEEEAAPRVYDIPLDLENETASAESPTTDEAVSEDTPPLVVDVPAAPVVEPPAAVDPVPVEEALAVLESTAPAAEPEPEPAQKSAGPEATPPPAPTVAEAKARDSELQTLFMTEEDLDAKAVVRLVCQLPGVSGCAVMFADGLRLAGNFPEGNAEGFSAMAPPFFKRTQHLTAELKLGALQTFTVHTETELVSFFMHDEICLSVRHAGRGFLPGVREKLAVVTRELAGMYSPAEAAASVDPGI